MDNLEVNQKAPNFTLPIGEGELFTLADHNCNHNYNGVVLFFYPKDDTSGCTKEAIEFSELKAEFEKLNIFVLGISKDSIKKHIAFKQKHNLTIELASDEELSALTAYGVWVEKSMYGRKYMGVERTTILLDKELNIQKIWHKVKVAGHAAEVLSAAKELLA